MLNKRTKNETSENKIPIKHMNTLKLLFYLKITH